jgi:2-keto-4-pentenoate hydratase/2-oxohepta-3-ene-1,7-dioic acid hydratase in catechol pathway
MRLVTFRRRDSTEDRLGALLGGDARVLDLHEAAETMRMPADSFRGMPSLIEAGEGAWDRARDLITVAPAGATRDASAIVLRAPLPRPIRMRDFTVFEAHASLAGTRPLPPVWYKWPVYYKCNHLAVEGPDATVRWPSASNDIDYELELAAVIGRGGTDIARDGAEAHIFGYTIFNDLSARDWQFEEMTVGMGPGRSKDFDGSNVLGPCIVTADEIGDPYALTMVARVNGEEWSRGSSGGMYHRFDAMIEFSSEAQTLHPGEILGSGTVGTGCGFELGKYLKRGDEVELEIERIGVLRTRIV